MISFKINVNIAIALLSIILIQDCFVCSKKTPKEIKICKESIREGFGIFEPGSKPSPKRYAKYALGHLRLSGIQNIFAKNYYTYLSDLIVPEVMEYPLKFCSYMHGSQLIFVHEQQEFKMLQVNQMRDKCIAQLSFLGMPMITTQKIDLNIPIIINQQILGEWPIEEFEYIWRYVGHVADSITLLETPEKGKVLGPTEFCSRDDELNS